MVIDESSTHRAMQRLYARAPVGQRAVCPATRNFGHNVSLLAALRLDGLGPALAVEGAVNTAIFTTYMCELLVPTLRPGDIVLLDNLGCHHAEAVQQAVEAVGAQLLFLLAYSPDFSPIEQAFSKLKAIVRRLRPPSCDALIDAIASACSLVTNTDALRFFLQAGFLNVH